MGKRLRNQLARSLACNCELNRKALCIKKSLEEIQCLLSAMGPCKRDCNKNAGKKKCK